MGAVAGGVFVPILSNSRPFQMSKIFRVLALCVIFALKPAAFGLMVIWMQVAGRLLTGLAIGLSSALVPVYISEVRIG